VVYTSVYHERLWYNVLSSWPSCYGQHGPMNSAINWSRFSGVGYGMLFHSRHYVERWATKVGREIKMFDRFEFKLESWSCCTESVRLSSCLTELNWIFRQQLSACTCRPMWMWKRRSSAVTENALCFFNASCGWIFCYIYSESFEITPLSRGCV